MYYSQNSGMPRAFITKAKQRLKQFGQNVYLPNSSEFELELYNPTSKTVLAKIKLNGTHISGGGIIVKPGQRIFLERYLDDARKFKFETYEVEANSAEVKQAISNNGDVTVEFYNEHDPIWDDYWNNKVYYRTNPYWYDNSFNSSNNFVGTSSINNFYNNTSITSFATMDGFLSSDDIKPNSGILRSKSLKRKSLETGTVEKGSHSDQSFTYVDKKFNSYTCATSYWKILPESQKPYEKQDIKVFCTECGTKRKKDSHKFCPNCGTQYQ